MNGDLLLEIQVRTLPSQRVNGKTRDILMIPFTGTASGPWFTGQVIGQGMDTQKISKAGKAALSARYMLEGTDKSGQSCRVFIENQGCPQSGLVPRIVTDSPLLRPWETADLFSTLEIPGDCVIIRIFRRAETSRAGRE